MKMYILILDTVAIPIAINSAAHAGLIGYLTFQDRPLTKTWLDTSFKKVTVKVNEDQLREALLSPDLHPVHERGALVGAVSAPGSLLKLLKKLPLYDLT